MTDIPTITQEEAVEVIQEDREAAAALVRWQREATEAWENADGEARQFFVPGFSRAIIQGIWDEHPVVQSLARHRIVALSPNMDHAVGGEEAAWDWLFLKADAGQYAPNDRDYSADEMVGAFMAGLGRSTPPVNQDAVREALEGVLTHASDLVNTASHHGNYASIHQDKIDGLRDAVQTYEAAALATPPLDNTGLDAATVERCAEVARAYKIGFVDTADDAKHFIVAAIEALASGDRS